MCWMHSSITASSQCTALAIEPCICGRGSPLDFRPLAMPLIERRWTMLTIHPPDLIAMEGDEPRQPSGRPAPAPPTTCARSWELEVMIRRNYHAAAAESKVSAAVRAGRGAPAPRLAGVGGAAGKGRGSAEPVVVGLGGASCHQRRLCAGRCRTSGWSRIRRTSTRGTIRTLQCSGQIFGRALAGEDLRRAR